MHLLSWNVNGIRAAFPKGLHQFLQSQKPDVLCLQEIKATIDQAQKLPWPKSYQLFWHPAQKAGYAGTAILTRITPDHVTRGFNGASHDPEGRILTLEFPDFFLVNAYTPNSQRGLTRLAYRIDVWEPQFRRYLKRLEKQKPVVFCGDLNVAHKEIDLANPKANERNAGFTWEERQAFDSLLKAGFLDSFRQFEPRGGHYTWWTYRFQARQKNIGWRLDYFGISHKLRDRLKKAFILKEIPGSDHCPVGIALH